MNTNIIDFGAVGDGVKLNTSAIQSAIDKCAESGGGRVTVPAGIFKTGTIWLRSNVELHLEMAAELFASDNLDDYNDVDAYEQNFSSNMENWLGKHLIIAHEVENCALTGFGTVNGNCVSFVTEYHDPESTKVYGWCHGVSLLKDNEKKRPGQLICFIESRRVTVSGITIKDSPCWSCFFYGCEYVSVTGIKVFNPIWMKHSDGIDIDSSRYVTVSDCFIRTGDDAITFRGDEARLKNKNMHCEYVTVTNCVIGTGIMAFRIGVGNGTVRHIRVSNITINQCLDIVHFATAYKNRGCANIEDVNFSNISAYDTDRCFEVFARNGAYIRNVTLENIRSTSSMVNFIDCIEGEIDNFNVRNVELYYFDRSLDLVPSELEYRGSNLILVKDAKRVSFDNVKIDGTFYGVEEPVHIENATDFTKKDCNF